MNTMLTVNPAPTTEFLSVVGMDHIKNAQLPLPTCAPPHRHAWLGTQSGHGGELTATPEPRLVSVVKQTTVGHREAWERQEDKKISTNDTPKVGF